MLFSREIFAETEKLVAPKKITAPIKTEKNFFIFFQKDILMIPNKKFFAKNWCAREDLNLHGIKLPQGPQPCASTNSATRARKARSFSRKIFQKSIQKFRDFFRADQKSAAVFDGDQNSDDAFFRVAKRFSRFADLKFSAGKKNIF